MAQPQESQLAEENYFDEKEEPTNWWKAYASRTIWIKKITCIISTEVHHILEVSLEPDGWKCKIDGQTVVRWSNGPLCGFSTTFGNAETAQEFIDNYVEDAHKNIKCPLRNKEVVQEVIQLLEQQNKLLRQQNEKLRSELRLKQQQATMPLS